MRAYETESFANKKPLPGQLRPAQGFNLVARAKQREPHLEYATVLCRHSRGAFDPILTHSNRIHFSRSQHEYLSTCRIRKNRCRSRSRHETPKVTYGRIGAFTNEPSRSLAAATLHLDGKRSAFRRGNEQVALSGFVIGRPDLIAKRSQRIGDQYLTDCPVRFRQNTFQ